MLVHPVPRFVNHNPLKICRSTCSSLETNWICLPPTQNEVFDSQRSSFRRQVSFWKVLFFMLFLSKLTNSFSAPSQTSPLLHFPPADGEFEGDQGPAQQALAHLPLRRWVGLGELGGAGRADMRNNMGLESDKITYLCPTSGC